MQDSCSRRKDPDSIVPNTGAHIYRSRLKRKAAELSLLCCELFAHLTFERRLRHIFTSPGQSTSALITNVSPQRCEQVRVSKCGPDSDADSNESRWEESQQSQAVTNPTWISHGWKPGTILALVPVPRLQARRTRKRRQKD